MNDKSRAESRNVVNDITVYMQIDHFASNPWLMVLYDGSMVLKKRLVTIWLEHKNVKQKQMFYNKNGV